MAASPQIDPQRLSEEIRREVIAALAATAPTSTQTRSPTAVASPLPAGLDLVTERDVAEARRQGGRILVRPRAIITPLARDAARRYDVSFIEEARPGAATISPVRPLASPLSSGSGNPVVLAPRRQSAPAATVAEAHSATPAATKHSNSAAASAAAPSSTTARAPGCDHNTRIALASDHAGFELKSAILHHLKSRGFAVLDFGVADAKTSVDYPDFIAPAAVAVARGDACRAILCDCHGNASAMTANKVPGIRAAASHSIEEVESSREHNDINTLCLGQKVLAVSAACAIVDRFLAVPFAGERHARRIDKVKAIERAFCSEKSS